MKKILFAILFVCSYLYGFSQDTTQVVIEEVAKAQDDDPVYVVVEQNASFQGGDISPFRNWVMSHVKYPESACMAGVEGKVILQFVVNTKGDVEKVRVLRSIDPACDAEAIRVIKASPKWVPAKQSGKLVKQQFVIPIEFKLVTADKLVTSDHKNADEEPVFVVVEQNASFQGGDINTFRDWIMTQAQYPKSARRNGIQGKVIAQFVVNAEGNIEKVKVLRSLDPDCDAEVVRAISSSPKWVPGKKDGKNVKQQFVLPVIFRFR